jgi:type IV pilus assembly protein PilC
MPDYKYVAYARDRKLVYGTRSAATADIASKILASNGYKVLSIKAVPYFLPRWEVLPSLKRISLQTIVTFSRQWALLIESGTDIVTYLELLGDQTENMRFREILGSVISDVRKGERLAEALAKHPNVFPKLYVQLIKISQQVGGTEAILRQVADYMEKDIKTSQSIKNALRYPIIVSAIGLVVVALLVFYVLPAFTSLYASMDLELPLVTRITLSALDLAVRYGPRVLILIPIIAVVLYLYSKTSKGKQQRDKLALKLPLIGRISQMSQLASCCRSISMLHRAGVPMLDIMDTVIQNSNNFVIRQGLTHVQRDVLKGSSLSETMAHNEIFLPLMVSMIRVGEATGKLDITLNAVADSYEMEAANKTGNLIELIQPVVIAILGVVVGFIAMTLISTMYSMYGQV